LHPLSSPGYDKAPNPETASEATARPPARRRPGNPVMNTTPVSLLERLRQPDQPAAWERFVELYTPLLYYWARRIGLQESDAADLVQEVFTVLLRKLPEFTYDRSKSFRAWLRTITLNKWREKQRHAGARRETGDAALPDLAGADSAEAVWETEYRQHLVRRALEVMQREFQPATWKACWSLVVEGRSAADVAAELGLSAGAVRSAKFRVLCRLREELEGLLD
jgi:RNA polymerase sigma-70 factor (ECF subfamily)